MLNNEMIRLVIEAEEPVLAGSFGELAAFERALFAVRDDSVALSLVQDIEQGNSLLGI